MGGFEILVNLLAVGVIPTRENPDLRDQLYLFYYTERGIKAIWGNWVKIAKIHRK